MSLLAPSRLLTHGVGSRPLLAEAEAAWSAGRYDATLDALLDLTGNGHHAVFGSTVGVDTNDPKYLPYSGGQYLYFPGTAGNSATTPDAAPLDILSDHILIGYIEPDDFTPAAAGMIVGKWDNNGNERGYTFFLGTDGTLGHGQSTNGTTQEFPKSTASISAVPQWVMVVDEMAASVTFYTSFDPPTTALEDITWVQLGDVVSGSVAVINDSSAALEIGANNAGTGNLYVGMVKRAAVIAGLDPTAAPAFDADFITQPTAPFATFIEGSSNAATVTINRSATGRKSEIVDRSLLLLGTDNYLEVPDDDGLDFGAEDPLTIVYLGRTYDTSPAAVEYLIGKKNAVGNAPGWSLISPTSAGFQFRIADGSGEITDGSPSPSVGQAFVLAGVRGVAAFPLEFPFSFAAIEAYLNGTASGSPTNDTTSATLANALTARIGATGAGTPASFLDGSFFAAALFRRFMSDEEVAQVGRELEALAA